MIPLHTRFSTLTRKKYWEGVDSRDQITKQPCEVVPRDPLNKGEKTLDVLDDLMA